MTEEESPGDKSSHASRVGRKRQNRSLKILQSGSKNEWPANLGELLEWHTNEVEEVMRAAQMRLRDSVTVIEDYRQGKIDLGEAQERVMTHDAKWGQIFPGGIDGTTRGKSDEEINSAIEAYRASKSRG
jgi:hypothetical protein